MSQYYKGKRARNLFDPSASEPFRLSRSKLERFLDCPRCFYLDRRLGIDRPPGFPFALNSAVDHLLKKEFDVHRVKQTTHPLLGAYGLDFVPFQHPKIEEWRDALRGGVIYHHRPSNFIVTGGLDDVWVNKSGELIVVDYKATSKDTEVNLDADWQIGYKLQVELYQWLLRRNDFKVSPTAYFVYVNGRRDLAAFDGKLEFTVKLLPYEGNDAWVEPALIKAQTCLMSDSIPAPTPECDYCLYRAAAYLAEEKKTLF
jgi:RecB family exonuclease